MPIALISFVLVFFIPTSSNIKFNNIKYNISSYNKTHSYSFFNNNNYNITDSLSQDCKSLIIHIKNQDEIEIIKKINLAIKITIIILFSLAFLNVLLVIFMVKGGGCYEEDYGGYCQTWEDTFSLDHNDKISIWPIYIYLLWIIICLGIIALSILSIIYSKKFKNKMKDCNFDLGKDYTYKNLKISNVFLIIIIILFLLEIIFSVYSICFAIFAMSKTNKNKEIENTESKEANQIEKEK